MEDQIVHEKQNTANEAALKKNMERQELKDWVIQQIDEDTTFDMTHEDAISKLIEKMEGKFEVSK